MTVSTTLRRFSSVSLPVSQGLTTVIEIFKDTLVPASLVGFFTTASSLLLSGYVGGLVDTHSRLAFVRHAIASQKVYSV